MNKFKKIMLGSVVAAGVSCLCGAAACSAPKYYKLTFEGSGIDYVLQDRLAEFENGGSVKKGVDVRFTVSLGANTIGEPVISLSDGTTLTPDENGVYSFVMNGETKVSASGLNGIYTLKLDRFERVLGTDGQYRNEERRVTYLDEQGNPLGDEVRLEGGSNFKFKLGISSYYLPSCSVSCGYEVLEADSKGVYTVENITSDSSVTVSGLVQEDSFFTRGNCGSGTEDDPYLLSRPIDMFYLAAVVNDEFYANYRNRHFKLASDIDMQGEQLFVIGDMSNESAAFMGTFDGNGKTISNFYITDEVIDQESYENEYLNYVGLFGNAVATTSSPVVIKNLNLKDYEVRVHPGESKSRSLVGSLVGSGIGVQITNCHAEGEIIAFGDDNQIVFMGGLAGFLQAAYRADSYATITYDSYVRSSSTDVNIEGTGSPRAAGGIVGYLFSTDTHAIAYVVNSYSSGNIYGAMHAGGIVGTLGRYSSVTNCYSTSNVSASNTISSALITSDYMVAYAGGIVGYADEDTVVASCYAANGRMSATSVHGASYQDTGKDFDGVIGHAAAKQSIAVNSAGVISYNNHIKRTGASSAMFKETLGWSEKDWDFSGDLPVAQSVGGLNGEVELTVVVKDANNDNFVRTYSYTVSANRPPVHEWYRQNKLPEYESNENNTALSWGYYFDKALTQKVPYGFVPATAKTTLYVGFADYSEVAGTYYVSDATYSNGAYIELDGEGNVFFRNGGLTYRSKYTYDGNEIVLMDSALANLLYTMEEIDGNYFTVKGVKTDEGFVLSGTAILVDVENSTDDNPVSITENMTLSVVKASNTFVYGEYLAESNGSTYLFSKGGTGVFINERKVRQSFTYTVSGNEVNIVYDGGNGGATATLSPADGKLKVEKVGNLTVRLKDGFAGVWRTTANSDVSFDFNGFGEVKYTAGGVVESVDYDSEGNFSIDSTAYKATINEKGVLEINGKEYYLSDGFTGTWYFGYEKESIELTLEGIGRNGYGYATISYVGNKVTSLNAQYDVMTDSYGTSIRLFVDDRSYGELTFNPEDGKASGMFYSMHNSAYYLQADFCLYDNFKGTWVSNSAQIDTITFDGMSASGEAEVTITAANGAISRGTYSLDDLTGGTVTVGGETYALRLDELTGLAVISLSGDTQLARRDNWYGVTLYEGDTKYEFDGKGYLNGTVKVSGGTELTYTVNGSSVTVGGETLTPTASGFTLGSKTLVFKSGFAGEWQISGSDYYLTVEEVGGSFKAKVTCSDPKITGTFDFVFNPSFDASSVTLSYTEEIGGERIVTRLSLLGSNEISIKQGDLTYNCIRTSLVDNWKGTYNGIKAVLIDEVKHTYDYLNDGTSWTFDGLGNCFYGSGTATFTDANGEKTSYKYKLNSLGVPYIKDINKVGSALFIESSRTDGCYGKDDNYYCLTTPDALYEKEVVLSDNRDLHFIFDGVSTLWKKDGDQLVKAYTYAITGDNEVVLTDITTMKKYKGTIINSGMYTYLTIVEI